MNSLEQAAKALHEELWLHAYPATSKDDLAIIAKHLEAFAREHALDPNQSGSEAFRLYKLACDERAVLAQELAQLKEQISELLKDKELLDLILSSQKFRVEYHTGYNNFCHEHQWRELGSRSDIQEALDKAAIAKGEV